MKIEQTGSANIQPVDKTKQKQITMVLNFPLTSVKWNPSLLSPHYYSHFVPAKHHYVFLKENPINPASLIILPMATSCNHNLYNPLKLYPIYMATLTNYGHLSLVDKSTCIKCNDWGFNFLKNYNCP